MSVDLEEVYHYEVVEFNSVNFPCTMAIIDTTSCSYTINANVQNADIHIESKKEISVEFGWVCGTDIGLPVLYASDGALITIDGQYLIVQKREFLIVRPSIPMWITDDGLDYRVLSNTDWAVE